MEVLILATVVILSMAAGYAWGYYWSSRSPKKPQSMGALRIDYSDPDGPYTFLVLYESIRDVESQEQVVLDVQVTQMLDNPQK